MYRKMSSLLSRGPDSPFTTPILSSGDEEFYTKFQKCIHSIFANAAFGLMNHILRKCVLSRQLLTLQPQLPNFGL